MYGPGQSSKQTPRGFSDPDVEEFLATVANPTAPSSSSARNDHLPPPLSDFFPPSSTSKIRANSDSGSGVRSSGNPVLNYSSRFLPSSPPYSNQLSPVETSPTPSQPASALNQDFLHRAQAIAELRATAGQIRDDLQVITSRTPVLNSVVIDVRGSRAVHVTPHCVHGVTGGSCGAIHCGQSAILPFSPLSPSAATPSISPSATLSPTQSAFSPFPITPEPTSDVPDFFASPTSRTDHRFHSAPGASSSSRQASDPIPINNPAGYSVDVSALDDILEYSDMDQKTTTQWKNSFQSMRDKFSTGPNKPVPLKLASDGSGIGWYGSLPRSLSNQVLLQSTAENPLQRSQSGHNVNWDGASRPEKVLQPTSSATTDQLPKFGISPDRNSRRSSGDALESWQKTLSLKSSKNKVQSPLVNDVFKPNTLPRPAGASTERKPHAPVNFLELNAVMEETSRGAQGPGTPTSPKEMFGKTPSKQQPKPVAKISERSNNAWNSAQFAPANASEQNKSIRASPVRNLGIVAAAKSGIESKDNSSLPTMGLLQTAVARSLGVKVEDKGPSRNSEEARDKDRLLIQSETPIKKSDKLPSARTLPAEPAQQPISPVVKQQPPVNFSLLDQAIAAVEDTATLGRAKKAENNSFRETESDIVTTTAGGARSSSIKLAPSSPMELSLINEVSNFLQKNVEMVRQPKTSTFPVEEKHRIDPADISIQKPQPPTVNVMGDKFHSPSPDNSSNASDNPVGLPHPKPKYSLREQLQSLGVEPRSPNWSKSSRGGEIFNFGSHPWATGNHGTVADRIAQLEKFPSVPATIQLQPAGTFNVSSSGSGFTRNFMNVLRGRTSPISPQPHLPPHTSSGEPSPSLPSPRLSLDSPTSRTGDVPDWASKGLASVVPRKKNFFSNGGPSSASQQPTSSGTEQAAAPASTAKPSGSLFIENKSKDILPPPQYRRPGGKSVPQPPIPRFYFPRGKPGVSPISTEAVLKKVAAVISQHSNSDGELREDDIAPLAKACDFPLYWKKPLFLACGGGKGFITFHEFSTWWRKMGEEAHDEASRFMFVLNPDKEYLEREDFESIVQDIVDSFPGLYFLRDAPEFHSRYVQTVIARIFYDVNRSWSGRISLSELKRSNLLDVIRSLEETEDINTVQDYFSYEHFYVIYCKFWEIDKDHDLFIDKQDLARHENGAILPLIIERIFSGAVTRGAKTGPVERLTYADFVYFLIAEEDKKHPTSMEYWFRCLDLDGDGVLSLYELEYFYKEMEHKIESISVEPMAFKDIICQLLDIIQPSEEGKIRLGDLKRNKMSHHFLNTFINMHKYYEQESEGTSERAIRSETGEEISDWDRFCAEEYEVLMQDEQAAQDTELNIDDSDGEMDPMSQSAPERDLRMTSGSFLLDAL